MSFPKGLPSNSGVSNEKFFYPPVTRSPEDELFMEFSSAGIESEQARVLAKAIARYEESSSIRSKEIQDRLEIWSNSHTHKALSYQSFAILHAVGSISHPGTADLRNSLSALGHRVTTIPIADIASYPSENYNVLVIQRPIQTTLSNLQIATLIKSDWLDKEKPVVLDMLGTTVIEDSESGVSVIGTSLGVHGTVTYSSAHGTTINITDNSHPITAPFETGTTQVYEETSYQYGLDSDPSIGTVLARGIGGTLASKAALIAYEVGEEAGAYVLPARVVVAEFIYASQDATSTTGAVYTDEGNLLVQSLLQWAVVGAVESSGEYGQPGAPGISLEFAAKDHSHGLPPVPSFAALSDTSFSELDEGQLAYYDLETGVWKNIDQSEIGGSGLFNWTGSAVTVSGVATFYITDDGTAEGTPIFSEIASMLVSAQADEAAAIDAPLASIKAVSEDMTEVTVNVVKGLTLAATSNPTVEFAPDDTVAYLAISGTLRPEFVDPELISITEVPYEAGTTDLPEGWEPGNLLIVYAGQRADSPLPSIPGFDTINSYSGSASHGIILLSRVLEVGDEPFTISYGHTAEAAAVLMLFRNAVLLKDAFNNSYSDGGRAPQSLGEVSLNYADEKGFAILAGGAYSDSDAPVITSDDDYGAEWAFFNSGIIYMYQRGYIADLVGIAEAVEWTWDAGVGNGLLHAIVIGNNPLPAQVTLVGYETSDLEGPTSVGSCTANVPAETEEGDLMVAHVFHRAAGGTVTAPAGWTLLRTDKAGDGGSSVDQWQDIYTRIATGSEPASYTWSDAGSRSAVGIFTVRNPQGTVVVEDSAHTGHDGTTNHGGPNTTSGGTDRRMLLTLSNCVYNYSGDSWEEDPTTKQIYGQVTNARLAASLLPVTEAGTITGRTFVHGTGTTHISGTVSLLLAPSS